MSRWYDVTLLTEDLDHVTVRASGNTRSSAERTARGKARRNGVKLSPFSAIQIQHVKEDNTP